MVFTCNKALVVAFLFVQLVAKKMKMIFLKLKSKNLLVPGVHYSRRKNANYYKKADVDRVHLVLNIHT